MKKLSISLLSTLAVVAAASMGCSSSSTPQSGDGGPTNGWVLEPSDMGFFDGTNMAGVLGAWYSYGDWYGGTPTMAMGGDCAVKGGFTVDQCSAITTPAPGQPFAKTASGMCTAGTVAKVIPMAGSTSPDYSDVWGAGVGFDMNNGGTDDGGTGAKLPYDATAHGVTGFSFHIDTPPTGGQMRVEFPTAAVVGTTDINSAYYGGATANLSPFTKGGDVTFHFKDVGGPMYLTSPMPFDATKILSMQFHVVSNTSSTIPFQYCISNLTALHD
jgi:hypothetical protein